MDNYEKVESIVHPLAEFQLAEDDGVINMKVNTGSKIRNITRFAITRMKDPKSTKITYSGTGPAVSKVITCVEIMKKEFQDTLYQNTRILYSHIDDIWSPKISGLDRLKVTRHIPAIQIILSKVPLSPDESGYQPPGPYHPTPVGKTITQDITRGPNKGHKRPKLKQQLAPAKRRLDDRITGRDSAADKL